jgi:hypothetical protein
MTPFLLPQPAHDAEVDRDQFAGVVDEEIAGMHVGVEEAVAQRLAQKGLNHRAGEAREVEALGLEPGAVGERRGLDPFEREHVARGAVPVDRGHAEIGIVLGVLGHFRERGRLEAQIHLDRDRAAQRLHYLDEPQPARFRGQLLGGARGEDEGVEIDLEAPLDARPQHLHRHRAAAAIGCDRGAMYLRDRSGRHRRPERGEQLADRLAQRGFDGALGLDLRERRHLVLQRLEIARQADADHVRPRGQELAELHIAGAEAGERGRQAVRRHAAGWPLDQPRHAHGGTRRRRQQRGVDAAENALACTHETGVAETDEMGDGVDHGGAARSV